MSSATHPYAALTPDVILDAVDATGLVADGHLQALNSYENRVYKVGCEDPASVVIKFYRPDRLTSAAILEEHGFALALKAQELPVVAPLEFDGLSLLEHAGFRYAVFPTQGGHAPEFESDEHLAWMGRLLARIHLVGETLVFRERGVLDVATLGWEPYEWLLDHDMLPANVHDPYTDTAGDLLEAVEARFDALGDVRGFAIHGDCHPGNVLWTDAGPHFVDLDDCRTGPAIQDLWMMLSGGPDERAAQFAAIAEGYEQFRAFDYRELQLVEPLRALRIIHYAYWLARRWDDPAFPINFPWFGSERYWEEHLQTLLEQSEKLATEPH